MIIKNKLFSDMFVSLEKSVAIYELLHAHARGETDLTEDQLANVVTGVALETRDVIHEVGRVRGTEPLYSMAGWIEGAHIRATGQSPWRARILG